MLNMTEWKHRLERCYRTIGPDHGGTGSFGREFAASLLKNSAACGGFIYSRDELKTVRDGPDVPRSTYPQMRFFIGDVRDKSAFRAMEDVDVVVHAAALNGAAAE